MRADGDQSSPEIGRVLEGRYRLDAPLGEGGLGVVWRGFHLRLGKAVAVKLMLPEHLGRENLHARFEREAKSLAALSHPNIVDVIDFGVDGETPFLVMELLEGRPLDRAIEEGIAPDRALAIARDVARALGHAHGLGIVHRDLKPANVFLQRISDGSEIVRVLDFGLAKFLDREGREGQPQLTRAGTVLGTPSYMAPEQATGGSADARADVYSFGIVLFELLTGRRPFVGEGGELIRQHLLVALPPIESVRPDLDVSPDLERVLQRATAKSPAARYASANELVQDLFALPPGSVRARPGVARIPTTRPKTPDDDATSAGGRDAPPPSITGHEPTQVPIGATAPARPSVRGALEQGASDAAARAEGSIVPAISAEASDTVRTSDAPLVTSPDPAPVASLVALASDASARPSPVPAPSLASGAPSVVTASSIPGIRRRPSAAAWIAIAAAVLVPSVAAIALFSWWRASTDPHGTVAAPTPPTSVVPAPPDLEPPAPWFTPDPDPWAGDVPAPLAAIHARLEQGRTLTRANRSTLRRYVVRSREDPRPWLLLAHGGLLEGARTDACEFYDRALGIDEPRARGDSHILPDLATMAAHHAVADTAADLIRRHWGARALPEIERAIERAGDRDREGVARLQRLRDQIAAGATVPVARP